MEVSADEILKQANAAIAESEEMLDDDPWIDDAVIEEGEENGLDGCPFGQMMNEETGKCEALDESYSDEEYAFDDNFDDFEEEMLEDESEYSETEAQEIIDESVGINPQHIKISIGVLFMLLLCVVIPILLMMRRRDQQRMTAKGVLHTQHTTVTEDDSPEEQDLDIKV